MHESTSKRGVHPGMQALSVEYDFPRRLGQYEILRELGRGGMARVFEAEHVHLKKRVAIKLPHAVQRGVPTADARFVREGRAAARVRHLHVVEVFDVGLESGVPYLVMELLDGQTLADLLRDRGSLPLQTVAEIFLPIISAVATAHDHGLVHRDLKPSNIMLTLQGRGALHPVVLDFGISKFGDDDEGLTASGTVLGTPHYLAPEQAHGAKFSSPRSDQYSIGTMLYECVTGQRPFTGEGQYALLHAIVTGKARPAEELNQSLPPDFAALLRRCMHRSPELRFASVRELGLALLPFAASSDAARWAREFQGPLQRPVDETATSAQALSAVDPSQTRLAASSSSLRSRVATAVALAGMGVLAFIALQGRGPEAPRASPTPSASNARPSDAKPSDSVTLSQQQRLPPAAPTSAQLNEPAAPGASVVVAPAWRQDKPSMRVRARPAASVLAAPAKAPPRPRARERGTNDAPIIE